MCVAIGLALFFHASGTVTIFFLLASLVWPLPLTDFTSETYNGNHPGGLWEDGSNNPPTDHAAGGLRRAGLIRPLDANGRPSPRGRIAFVSVGDDETSRIFRAFTAMAPPQSHVTFVNGASPGFDAQKWIWWFHEPYNAIDRTLAAEGLTPQQVQVAWVELSTAFPVAQPLPIQDSDAYRLKGAFASTLRALKIRYPNLQVAYLSSRVYAGYATTMRNPEPYAYESAFSVRWVVSGQATLMRTGFLWDSRIGDVDYERGQAPWVTWGPYLWANGTSPRSDGLTWERTDFASDGETLSEAGAQKAGRLLLNFLAAEPTARNWFHVPPARPRAVRR